MSLAETVLAESTGTQVIEPPGPQPNTYVVGSSGTLEVPDGAIVQIVAPDSPEEKPCLKVNGVDRGEIYTLENGDYEVVYESSTEGLIHLQFRQTGDFEQYLFGVAIPEKTPLKAMDDPPITGVWGAEAPPPEEPNPEG